MSASYQHPLAQHFHARGLPELARLAELRPELAVLVMRGQSPKSEIDASGGAFVRVRAADLASAREFVANFRPPERDDNAELTASISRSAGVDVVMPRPVVEQTSSEVRSAGHTASDEIIRLANAEVERALRAVTPHVSTDDDSSGDIAQMALGSAGL